jgi:S-DNA-T family DNA segregation ATPase FtsK/SpoIIIE
MIRDGLMLVVGIDPKGGMELGPGRELFHVFARPERDPARPDAPIWLPLVEALEWAAGLMLERSDRLFGARVRKYQPTQDEPAVLIIVDELAFLTSYLPDPALRKRANQALAVLGSQGRAPGFTLLGAVQDPRKDVVSFRHLFTERVALRTVEAVDANLILGDGARDRGAATELIPDDLPGVAYVYSEGRRELTRVRAGWVTDDDIAHLVERYTPRAADVIDITPAVEGEGVPA